MKRLGRDDLIEEVKYGRMTPREAEAEAARLGWEPLASKPDPKKFSPIGEVSWTLPMTIAWIAWRNVRDLLDFYDPYRLQCWDWHYREWRQPGGPVFKGHFLLQRERATLTLAAFAERHDVSNNSVRENSIPVNEAEALLWKALQDSQLQATGIPSDGDQRKVIPDYEWHDLKPAVERARDVVRYGPAASKGYNEVLFRRQVVMAFWRERPSSESQLRLPPTIRPDGPGYFPLYCAAQWIATRGGDRTFDPIDTAIWHEAYAELTARIASGHVGVTGIRGGVRERIEGHIFGSIRVDHPFLDTPLDLLLSDELFLCSYPYVDAQHWQNGFDDSLQTRGGIKWLKLMVLKSEVAQFWPFSAAAENEKSSQAHRTGAPGRPTPMHLIVVEHGRRLASREAHPSVMAESEELARWLRESHPTLPSLTPKTIRNRISAEHRRSQKSPKL